MDLRQINAHLVTKLKQLARDNELNVVERENGHFTIEGGMFIVHWWPYSKQLTGWREGAPRGVRPCRPHQVIELALTGRVTTC